MKKFLLSSVALLGLTTVTMAADLPRRAAPPAFAPVPVFTWTGFYVGVNAGYAWGNNDNDVTGTYFLPAGSVINSAGTNGTLTVPGVVGFGSDDNNDGFTGGGQVGFNYQIGAFVVGIEADLQWADLGGNNNAFAGTFPAGTYTFVGTPGVAFTAPAATVVTGAFSRGGIEWWGTVRARLGVAFDRALIYATGGFAFGGGGDDGCGVGFGFGFNGCGDDDWRGGYAVGGGVEYAFTNNLTAKIEGLYVNLDRGNDNVGFGGVYDPATNRIFVSNTARTDSDDFFVLRAGLNYKF